MKRRHGNLTSIFTSPGALNGPECKRYCWDATSCCKWTLPLASMTIWSALNDDNGNKSYIYLPESLLKLKLLQNKFQMHLTKIRIKF